MKWCPKSKSLNVAAKAPHESWLRVLIESRQSHLSLTPDGGERENTLFDTITSISSHPDESQVSKSSLCYDIFQITTVLNEIQSLISFITLGLNLGWNEGNTECAQKQKECCAFSIFCSFTQLSSIVLSCTSLGKKASSRVSAGVLSCCYLQGASQCELRAIFLVQGISIENITQEPRKGNKSWGMWRQIVP